MLFITLAGLVAWGLQTARDCRPRELFIRAFFVGSIASVIGFLPYALL